MVLEIMEVKVIYLQREKWLTWAEVNTAWERSGKEVVFVIMEVQVIHLRRKNNETLKKVVERMKVK